MTKTKIATYRPWRAGALVALLLLGGCATKAPGNIYFVKPSPFPVKVSNTPESQGGSVFPTNSTGSLYGNQSVWEDGDLVTVNVTLSTTAQDNNTGALSKTTSINDGVTSLFGIVPQLGSLNGSPFSPSFGLSDKQNFSGSGSTSGSNTVTTEMTAVVTHIEPNGVLALSGRTNVNINGNVTGIVVTGYARPQDIGPNNTISSAQLADANIQYVGVGSINSAHHVPWLESTISKYSPF
jgi:flagellar L-ring protein precursor FlgH